MEPRRIITIDTPRSRGLHRYACPWCAGHLDIAILVVAADDGARAQTVEAINHAQAVSKSRSLLPSTRSIRKARTDKTLCQLTEYGLVA